MRGRLYSWLAHQENHGLLISIINCSRNISDAAHIKRYLAML